MKGNGDEDVGIEVISKLGKVGYNEVDWWY